MNVVRLSPTTRQTTRALQEIQSQRESDNSNETVSDITTRLNFTSNSCEGLLHGPSPDEAVIQARGRRQVPITFSPDIRSTPAASRPSTATMTSSRLLLPSSRDPPRKRLRLQDSPPERQRLPVVSSLYSPSPDKQRHSPVAKRLKLSPRQESNISPEIAVKGLSHGQLTSLISNLLNNHPQLKTEINQLLPAPDLSSYEENLNYLKKNIYKALPNSRLVESKNDALAYNRVSVHLLAFKKCLSEGLKTLLESQQWLSVVDYVIMAWSFVRSTPLWSNPCHNTIRKTCFKTLASGCMRALKEGMLCEDPDQCKKILTKLEKLKPDSDEILVCCKFVEFIIKLKETVQ